MSQQSSGTYLVPTLWFVAAALAAVAFGIPFFTDRDLNWGAAAGGLFCLVMGIAALRRQRPGA